VKFKVDDNGRDNCERKIRLVSSKCLSIMQDESIGEMVKVKVERDEGIVFRPKRESKIRKSGEDRCI